MNYWEGRAREHTAEIERLRRELAACRAASPPAPAAIVVDRLTHTAHLFEGHGDDDDWLSAQPASVDRYFWAGHVVRHPPAQEGGDEGRD